MNEYIGRKKELALLESKWESDGFVFGVVYGRRRVGKTSLLYKFLENKKNIFLQATKDKNYNLRKFSSSIGKTFFEYDEIPPYDSFATALSVIAKHAGKERIAIIIDEISYLAESDSSILSVLQSFIDQEFRDSNIFLVLCGSNMAFMERDLLGINSPVYGRRSFQIKLMPFLIDETAQMLSGWKHDDIASAHVITSGIPYYLSFIKEYKELKEAIKSEFFTTGGRLYTEGRLYLMMELRSLELYDSILGQIAFEVNEVTKIADKTGRDKSSVSQALQKLSELGIVKKRKKISGKGIDKGWLFFDRYFQFFYHYVFPYSDMIDLGATEAICKKAIDDLPIFIGHAMEDVFHTYILMNANLPISEIGNVEFPNPITHKNEEIDLVAVSRDTLILGECKWRNIPIGIDVYEELVRRSQIAYPNVQNKIYYILSRSGFTDDIKTLANKKPNNIFLISIEDLFSKKNE